MTKYYIRFGGIPKNGKSAIHDITSGKILGYENGISCWECTEDLQIIVPNTINCSGWDDLLGFITKEIRRRNGEYKVYLLTGNEIDIGTDGEPIITNIKLIKEVTDEFYNFYNWNKNQQQWEEWRNKI